MILVQSLLQQLSGNKIFTLLMIFICCCNGLAQNDDISHFIIHKVKKNETLGQIAIRYNIDKDKIIEFNLIRAIMRVPSIPLITNLLNFNLLDTY